MSKNISANNEKTIRSTVALVKSADRVEGLRRGLQLIGGLRRVVGGKHVLVKVNMAVARAPETGSTCDPLVLAALIDRCYDEGAVKVVVADGSAVDMKDVLKVNQIDQVAEEKGASFIDLNEGPFRLVRVLEGLAVDGYVLSEPVLRSEALINVAKMKPHTVAGVTLCMKNLMGCILGGGQWDGRTYHWYDYSDRRKIHSRRCHEALVDLNRVIRTGLNIIDGFTAQEGESPFYGDPVDMRTFILGEDRVAVDAIGAKVMGVNPQDVGHIKIASDMGLGDMVPTVLGEKIEETQRRFRLATVLSSRK